jgi:DNA-binding MarR family transcriptional regulator
MTKRTPHNTDQEEYVLQILRAARRLEAEGDRLFHAHGLTVAQFNVLNLLHFYEPMPQGDLAAALVVGKATVSSVLAGLVRRRLIIQAFDERDRRARVLRLSPAGAKLWQNACRDYTQGLRKNLPGVTAAEVALLRKALAPCPLK